MTIRNEYILEGLNCAHCASKIETEITNLDEVKKASLNFVTKVLTIEVKYQEQATSLAKLAAEIINKHEPDVRFTPKDKKISIQKKLILKGLHCAGCGAKIEERVKKVVGVKSAVLDFTAQKLIFEIDNNEKIVKIIKEIKNIIAALEPDVEVKEEGNTVNNIEQEEGSKISLPVISLISGAILFFISFFINSDSLVLLPIFFIAYLLAGGDIIYRALRNISRGQIFDENFLMTIATIGAFGLKEYSEAIAVMLFYKIGIYFQNKAVNNSRKSIAALMDIRPDYASLKVGTEIIKVSPQEVKPGDIIEVRPGEKIPLDGEVTAGFSAVDTSALTGESLPKDARSGDEVLSGYINISGLLTIRVNKSYGESTVSKILDLIENAGSRKAKTENFITKFARYYTPAVVLIAIALGTIPPLVLSGATFSDWLYRGLLFLVISCPCALVISIPLGFFGGIGAASKHGILIKGANYLEALNDVETVIFDKTGTLTKGKFEVTKIVTSGNLTTDQLLEYAAYAENSSNHPIALSIVRKFGKSINKGRIISHEEIAGYGVRMKITGREILVDNSEQGGKIILIGNKKLMEKERIDSVQHNLSGSIVHIAVNGKYEGYITIADEIKEDSAQAIAGLKKIGIQKSVMLTGDAHSTARKVASTLNIDEVYAELLPHQKVEILEQLEQSKSSNGKIIFVGDGINDAPVYQPSRLVDAIKIAKKTKQIIWQNIALSLGIKFGVLLLGALGMATMWEAVFADVGVTILAVTNAIRVLKM